MEMNMRDQPSVRIAFDLPISVKAYNALKDCYGQEYIVDELIEMMVQGLRLVIPGGNVSDYLVKLAEENNIAAEEMEIV